jgi:hypothetical protein
MRVWTAAAAATLATGAFAAVAIGAHGSATPILSEKGVGGLKLGRSYAAIKKAGLIGKVTPGCELASPRPYGAKLRSPLKGFATFTGKAGHRVLSSLVITGGAKTAKGIKRGSTAAAIHAAYPTAKDLDSKSGDPIQIHAIVLKRNGKDKIWFVLSKHNGVLTEFGVPSLEICE